MEVCASLPFGGGSFEREITAHLPERLGSDVTFLLCTDGQGVPHFAEHLRQASIADRVALIGVHSSQSVRGQEYVEGRDEQCFRRHEDFFVEVVRAWIEDNFDVQLTRSNSATFGYSCGGSFAMSMAMRHPTLFGSVIALSIAGRPVRVETAPPELLDLTSHRFYLGAGMSEPGGMKKYMQRLAGWLRKYGAQSEYHACPGGHEIAVWRHELSRGLEWLTHT